MTVTIKDIAREAGVSFSTVSSVLRSPGFEGGRASAATRKKIVETARRLDYHPSFFGRGLRTGKSRLIAFLGSSIDAAVIMEAMVGAESICHRYDYSLLIGTYDAPGDLQKQLERLVRRGVDGVLISYRIEPEFRDVITEYSRKLRIINLFGAADGQYSVYVDPANIGRLAAEYLLELGHTRILISGGRPVSGDAFCETFFAAGLPEENLLRWDEFYSFEHGGVVVEKLIALGMPVTAIVAHNDSHAAGILQQAQLRGIRVPEDLSVLGVNNESICSKLIPPLTTIAQPMREQGERAMENLINLINGSPVPEFTVLQPYLKTRASCAAPGR